MKIDNNFYLGPFSSLVFKALKSIYIKNKLIKILYIILF